eukprot:132536-Ditylum_brightwellii.AAC.1
MLYIFQRSEYDEGMRTFSAPVSLRNKTCYRNSLGLEYYRISLMVTILYNLGQLHVQIGEDNKATDFFNSALDLAQTRDSYLDGIWGVIDDACDEGVRLLAILHNLGHIQYRSGRYSEAMTKYTEALKVAHRTFGPQHIDVASTLNCI